MILILPRPPRHKLKGPARWAYYKLILAERRSLDKRRKRRDVLKRRERAIMHELVGAATIGWANMERSLDEIVQYIFNADTKRIIQADIPVTLDNKLAYLKKARKLIPWLAPLQPKFSLIQSKVKEANKLRKHITHGILRRSDKIDYTWTAVVLRFEGPKATELSFDYNLDDFSKFISLVDETIIDICALAEDMFRQRHAYSEPDLDD